MPIDPTIPLGIQTPQNPLQQIQTPMQTAAGLLALKQNQLQLGANQAISQAYSQAVDPNTGQVDFGKLQALAAENGAGAYLPQFMGQLATQRNQQQQFQSGQLDMALKQQQAIRGMIGSLAVDPNVGKSDMSGQIAGQISNAVQSGLLPLDQGIREIQNIPADPQAQAAWIQNHLLNSLSGEARIQALMPQNVVVPTGAGTALLNRNPLTGQTSPGTFVQNALSPADLAAPKTIIGPNGEQRDVTTAQWLAMQNGGGVPGLSQTNLAFSPSNINGAYSGRMNTTPLGVQTSLGPGQQAALTAQGSTSNAAAQQLHDAAADAPMRINLLQTAQNMLGNITTGPGTDWRNTAASFINSTPAVGAIARAAGLDPNNISSFDQFKKILTNYSSSVSGSLGSGTDARLNAAITGNANPNISTMANEDILAKTIAAERMRQAQDYAFQNSGLTTDKFNQWQSQWNKQVDPNAFVFTSMNPDQRQDFVQRMQKNGQWGQFQNNLGNLVRQGIIQMPNQGGQ